ncbi:tryptophan--tRNA ligase [Candidatus Uhrbacteria bacterium]|nr:tryptophan--tRNA ligase [Candidatus Uhrbacteria bacterium]
MKKNTNNKKKRILTGDRPTGPLHIGHYVGSLMNRVKLQDEYDCFFIIADYQVLTDHLSDTAGIEGNIREILLDWLAVGLDPDKSTFFIQSRIPQIAELTMYFSMIVSVSEVQRNPTVKDEMKAAKIGKKEMSYGFMGYPISQAADIMCVRADLVPVGEDQLPHIEHTREIARRFNRLFSPVFPEPQALLGSFPRLPGIDGQKMSKSRNNAIFLKDSPDDVRKKIMQAYTDPTRIHATDPGHLEGNVVFAYLDAFLQDKDELDDWKKKYKKGHVGDVALKKRLIEILTEFLAPIQEQRAALARKHDMLEEILATGIKRATHEAQTTLELARQAMSLDYASLLRKK